MKYAVFTLLFVFTFGFCLVASAQQGADLLKSNVDVSMVPENPKANEKVTVSVVSYSTNINLANITWKINGKIIKSGTGEKSFNFSVGETNTTTVLDMVIKTFEGEVITKTYKMRPVDVDLVWQSNSYVPPFFKGKAMFSHENQITVIAMPHVTNPSGSEIPAKNLVYRWKSNGKVIDDASGYGKSSYTFTDPLVSRPVTIDVQVTSMTSESVGDAQITLNQSDPTVVFYKKDPLYGIEFQKALTGTVSLNDSKELLVVGMPLFFGNTNKTSQELTYKWSINGVPTNTDANLPSQVFRQKEGTSGTSIISLSVENKRKILQYASANFNLTFGNAGTSI